MLLLNFFILKIVLCSTLYYILVIVPSGKCLWTNFQHNINLKIIQSWHMKRWVRNCLLCSNKHENCIWYRNRWKVTNVWCKCCLFLYCSSGYLLFCLPLFPPHPSKSQVQFLPARKIKYLMLNRSQTRHLCRYKSSHPCVLWSSPTVRKKNQLQNTR